MIFVVYFRANLHRICEISKTETIFRKNFVKCSIYTKFYSKIFATFANTLSQMHRNIPKISSQKMKKKGEVQIINNKNRYNYA